MLFCASAQTFNSLYALFCSYFWLNAGILAVGLVIYAFIARSYTEKPILSRERVSGSGAVHTVCMRFT